MKLYYDFFTDWTVLKLNKIEQVIKLLIKKKTMVGINTFIIWWMCKQYNYYIFNYFSLSITYFITGFILLWNPIMLCYILLKTAFFQFYFNNEVQLYLYFYNFEIW